MNGLRTFCLVACLAGVSAVVAACGDTVVVNPDAGSTGGTGGTSDVGTGGTSDVGTGGTSDTGSGTASDSGGGADRAGLISRYTGACYQECLLDQSCGDPLFDDLADCEDLCDADGAYLLVETTDSAADIACLQALADGYECVASLSCDELTEYYEEPTPSYPCNEADTTEASACDALGWYQSW